MKCTRWSIDLRKANGLTVVIVTHLPDEISRIAERTVFVHDGRILEHGSHRGASCEAPDRRTEPLPKVHTAAIKFEPDI